MGEDAKTKLDAEYATLTDTVRGLNATLSETSAGVGWTRTEIMRLDKHKDRHARHLEELDGLLRGKNGDPGLIEQVHQSTANVDRLCTALLEAPPGHDSAVEQIKKNSTWRKGAVKVFFAFIIVIAGAIGTYASRRMGWI